MNVNEQDLGTTDVFIDLFGIYTSERLRRTDAVRTRLFGRNAKGHVPLVTSLTANTKLTAKPLMRSIVNGCMYANRHRFTTLPLDRILLEINEVESLDSLKNRWEKSKEYVCIICHKNSFKPCRKIRRK